MAPVTALAVSSKGLDLRSLVRFVRTGEATPGGA